MIHINLDEQWTYRKGYLDSIGMLAEDPGEVVNLPHDAMISTKVSKEATAGVDSGYFEGVTCNYTKYVMIPDDWKKESIFLKFDGVMMHSAIDINGCKVAEHHYGYTPFFVDITRYVTLGEENRITINTNSGTQPSSRWYTGCGIFRSVELCHAPKVHIVTDGIFLSTKRVEENTAFLEAQIDIANDTPENRLVEVTVELIPDDCRKDTAGNSAANSVVSAKQIVQVNPGKQETARMSIHLMQPMLWDVDHPNLYQVTASVRDLGEYRTHLMEDKSGTIDKEKTLFGVRTITADSIHGLRINGETVKLKGGCLHHDNGLMGAVSLYEAEARKVKKLKEVGFNAIRTTHNPPSKELVEACDRLGMYIFDEAFDAWGIAKRIGDYSQYFSRCWEEDLTAFVRRDRVHPSVIIWSTGNEIPERGGLNNGYTLATRLAEKIRSLDSTRPISNGICSFWSGLDDYLAKEQDSSQNAKGEGYEETWEKGTEPFCNGLDIVGYNYMEDLYERDHEKYPERVILGSENFPQEIGFRWPMVEKLPYVIGDFTWTAWDYIGEAGIGKAVYVSPDDPLVKKGPWALMPQATSSYPWRTANDADYDITGRMLPQGAYRSVVFGNTGTYLYSVAPEHFGKVEMMSMWGFTAVQKNWNYSDYEGKPIQVVVFSVADEVELFVNGQSIDRKEVSQERPMPNSVRFDTIYHSGKVEAVSYKDGVEISRDCMETTGAPAKLRIVPEKDNLKNDAHDLVFVQIDVLDENDRVVPDAELELTIAIEGAGSIAGFGTGNPITEEVYTDDKTRSYRGHACALIRSGSECGEIKVSVTGKDVAMADTSITVCG